MASKRPHTVRFVVAAARTAQFPGLKYPEAAIVGRSNVGKSSLLNRLVGIRKVARVSKTPGRTQQIQFFVVDEELTLVDFPGYGFAQVPQALRAQWSELVAAYFQSREQLRLVLMLVDLRRGLEAEEHQLLEWLAELGKPCIVVATKADKATQAERVRTVRGFETQLRPRGIEWFVTSAATGEGIAAIWKAILRGCGHALP